MKFEYLDLTGLGTLVENIKSLVASVAGKVNHKAAATTKAYITGTTSSTDNTDNQIFDPGVYLDTTAGQLVATTFKGNLDGNAATASTATKLGSNDGTATKPVYFSGGKPVACTYELNKTVPSDAKFTDTVYTHPESHPASMITGLASIATTGNYNDLINTPITLSGYGITDAYTKTEVEALYKKLNTNRVLGFYCIEDVTIVTNGISTVHPANSNVEVKFIEDDVFEIIPTSNNSILTLTAFPGALGTFYPWLEGVKQFSNILFDMNSEDMYTKWNQGNQGVYQVQYAQYSNCIFWSDNPYITDVAKRTNYTLYYSAQIPLCYSHIPDNTFKSFYLAFNVNSDPNWGNKAYRDSFAKATWATQAFSYYGGRTIGIFDHDNSAFNIVLPTDCRGLMYAATAVENAGVFDAINTTNFGASSGSWRDAFGDCKSLRNLYIKNLKVNLNVSWSPLNYDSIYFIISESANTNNITITVSPYTYNLLSQSDFELAASKNITIQLLTTNYIEDRRLSAVTITGDGSNVLSDDGTYKTLLTVTKVTFTDSDSKWGELSDGRYPLTISASGGEFLNCYRTNGSNYDKVDVDVTVSGDNIVIYSLDKFAGYMTYIK